MAEPAVRTPRPVAGRDIRSLPLNPREAFLFSHIDGCVTEADLCSLTGFDAAAVRECLERLSALGAIEIGQPATADRAPPPRQPGTPPLPGPGTSQTQFRSPVQPREMEEAVDLDTERKRRVLDLYPRLGHVDYYALLGVPEGAEKKEIKRAYYAAAPNYHPDKFYGKKLGSFKPKMEAIFAQLTFAYDTLTSSERRAEYDAYLSTQKQTRSMEELLRSATAPAVEPPLEAEPFGSESARAKSPGAEAVVASEPRGSGPTVLVRTKEMDRARREALARKLGVGRSSIPPSITTGRAVAPGSEVGPKARAVSDARLPGPTSSPESIQAAARELKRRHDVMAGDGRRLQARRYVEAANASLKTNPAAAANALRLALTIDPNNPEIVAAHREAASLAAVALADGYLKQGDYESRNGQWLEAARSYERAAAGRPEDHTVLHKAAQAIVKSSGDMHRAADFAKKAVLLSPKRVEPRLTLIEVYIAAGLPLAAKREIEQARSIAPQDVRIAELSKRLK